MASRPLTLHASALTNEEYTLYTTSLCDLAGEDEGARRSYHEDSYYAALKISAREARAWIRGRYTDLAPSSVDAVLKLFCPNMTVTDVLTGGQFFAALRLVTHVRHGRALDGNLVFVQAHPDDALSPTPSGFLDSVPISSSRTSGEVDRSSPEVDLPSSRSQPVISTRGPPPPPPPKPVNIPTPTPPVIPSTSTNPFLNRSRSQPPHGSAASTPSPSQSAHVIPPLPPRKLAQPPLPPPRHASLHALSSGGVETPTTPSAFTFWNNQHGSTPTNPNVLMQQSLQAGRIAQSLKKAEQKLEKERVLEVLKSSSKASSSSSSVRTRSISPAKEPTTAFGGLTNKSSLIHTKTKSVSSSSISGSASASSEDVRPSTRASSATITNHNRVPALPPRRSSRRVSPPPSSAASNKSFEQVAHASITPLSAKPRTQSPFVREPSPLRASPPPQHPDLLPPPPPTHPDRLRDPADSNPGSDYDSQPSPTSRVSRSKSMHYTSPPVPPRPRRRPESAQYGTGIGRSSTISYRDRTPSPSRTERSVKSLSTVLSSPASLPGRGGSGTVSRHMSLSLHKHRRGDSVSRDGNELLKDDSTISNIRNTLLGLHPKLEAARYKAEAGLSRRGYVSHGNSSFLHEDVEDRLVPSSASSIAESPSNVSVDSDDGGLGQDINTLDISDDIDKMKAEKNGQRWDGRRWDDVGRLRSYSGDGPTSDSKPKRPWEVERDDMKWPVGEGWRPL